MENTALIDWMNAVGALADAAKALVADCDACNGACFAGHWNCSSCGDLVDALHVFNKATKAANK